MVVVLYSSDSSHSQDQRPKWLVLLSDLLLLLDPHSQKESSFEWFSDNKYTTATVSVNVYLHNIYVLNLCSLLFVLASSAQHLGDQRSERTFA